MDTSRDLRYPIGPAPVLDAPATPAMRQDWIDVLEHLPARLRSAVSGFTPEQWDTPYRPGGWTVRQLVHHIPDSHLNAYTRTKLALTEDQPTVKPYDEDAWARLADTRVVPPEVALGLLDALHARWVGLWRSLEASSWTRTFRHPEHDRVVTLDQVLAHYAWHSEHHLRHITALSERMRWRRR